MTTETASPVEGMSPVDLPADAPESFNSVNEAAAYLSELQEKRKQPAESAETATAEPELADTANADPATDPGEEPDAAEPAEQPPIEPPRSWTQAEKERFQSLPRETQEYLHTREQERDTAFRRSQNELAEQRNAVKAEREAAEKVRQQYEASLPALMQELQSAQQNAFADIKTMDDVVKLQAEDPFRFQAWQVQQMRLQAAKAESDRVASETTQQKLAKRTQYDVEQTKLLKELVPEFADDKKFAATKERAIAMLNDDLGLKTDQLSRWYADDIGHEILSSAGFQKLIADGLKYRDVLNAPKAIAAKPLPPVQKPGTSRPAGSDASERIQALNRKPELSMKEAEELYSLQSARRAS